MQDLPTFEEALCCTTPRERSAWRELREACGATRSALQAATRIPMERLRLFDSGEAEPTALELVLLLGPLCEAYDAKPDEQKRFDRLVERLEEACGERPPKERMIEHLLAALEVVWAEAEREAERELGIKVRHER